MKDIKGYEGLYAITSCGKVYGYKRNKFLTPKRCKCKNNDHWRVTLFKDGKYKNFYIHRLVADAYIDNPNNYEIINHKDENVNHNYINNLEWCTTSYNLNYGTRNDRMGSTLSLIKGHKVLCLENNKIYNCPKEAALDLKCNLRNLTYCCRYSNYDKYNHTVFSEAYNKRIICKYVEE